jgi:hypothetical protein
LIFSGSVQIVFVTQKFAKNGKRRRFFSFNFVLKISSPGIIVFSWKNYRMGKLQNVATDVKAKSLVKLRNKYLFLKIMSCA